MVSTPAQLRAKRNYYRTHKASEAKKARQRMKQRRVALYARIDAIKESTPCADCKECFPAVCMDFDHHRGDKTANVSRLVNEGYSLERIEGEIAKCELVCANCHRVRTRDRK